MDRSEKRGNGKCAFQKFAFFLIDAEPAVLPFEGSRYVGKNPAAFLRTIRP